MNVTGPEVRWIASAEAPDKTRFETFAGGRGAELYLSGRGSVRADAEAVTVFLADEAARGEMSGLACSWGRALWLALNGVFSFHGTVLERDGYCVALLGESRVGCSVTAMALTSHGWQLVTDGECPLRLDENGNLRAIPTENALEIDTALTAIGPVPGRAVSTGSRRPRSAISVPRTAADYRVSAVVELRLARSTDEPVLVPADHADLGAPQTLKMRCSIGDAVLCASGSLDGELDSFCEEAVAAAPFYVALLPEGRPGAFFPPSSVARFLAGAIESLGGPTTGDLASP